MPNDALLIDTDSIKLDATNVERRFRLLGIMGIIPAYIRQDRTEHGWHTIIPPYDIWPSPMPPGLRFNVNDCTVDAYDAWKLYQHACIIAAQAILGSDPMREAYNLKRLQCGVWLNQLFEPKL